MATMFLQNQFSCIIMPLCGITVAVLRPVRGIVQPFGRGGGREYTHSIPAVKLEARQVLKFFFNDTVSREEHKTIFSGLRISEMALSNQSHFPGFFSSPESHLIGFCKSCKLTFFFRPESQKFASERG